MQLFKQIISIALAGFLMIGLGACGKKKNGSSNASTPASTCTAGVDGQLRDQYGRLCNNYNNVLGGNNCLNTRYDAYTGRYLDLTTGQPVACNPNGYFQPGYSMPYYGMAGGQMIDGCSGWNQVYGAQYIPIDIGYGQRICMNVAYLQQNNPSYNWNQYYNNYANYGYQMYACYSYDCMGGYYGGYQYSCSTSLNLGFFTGGFGGNIGMCF